MINEVFLGDFFELVKEVEDGVIDCIITDPPYLIGYDHWDYQSAEFHDNWLKECYRIMKPGGTIWSFMAYCSKDGKELIGEKFCSIVKKYFNVDYRNTIIWARQKGRGSSKHLKSLREDVYYATKPKGKITWNSLQTLREVIAPYVKDGKPRGWFLDEFGNRVRWTGLGNVMTYSAPQWNGILEPQWHSAQKPILLIDRLIRLSSNEVDLILDPFSGSGSCSIACLLNHRNFVGMEINEEYHKKYLERFNWINDHLEQFKEDPQWEKATTYLKT